MFETVLVAHRGPLAARVVRTVQRLGAQAVTVHSEADVGARHVSDADESVLLGPASPQESYLDVRRVVEAARRTGAQAVHPGCGALAEDPVLAREVVAAGLAWVGPDPSLVGPPLGSRGDIGVQVLGLDDGSVVAVGEHLVRAPGTGSLDESAPEQDDLRAAAVRAAAGLRGVGTVELTDGLVRRLVPRLQAGHSVTELAQDVDLVEQQLLVAGGEPPSWRPGPPRGVALAARVYATAPGRLTRWVEPEGVRVDAGYREGGVVPPHYDPLLAVVTVLGPTREDARAALRQAVEGFSVEGVPTNLSQLTAALAGPSERTPTP